ncbi:MAG: Txe/YoeB family addiction module toxin [Synergistaceae bacterium]|nr:Txe/YoeB family addiction module toxin [Synergistaceae bacterium]
MKISWTEDAWGEYTDWQAENKTILKKINELVKDILRNGNLGIGKPEPLRHNMSGMWNRRITDEHRLVYRILDEELLIYSRARHYKD